VTVYTLNPLEDARWSTFVEGHPRASIFHTRGWLEATLRTYGYTPIVYTTSPPAASLTNGIVLCRVRSWLTGRRLVSVPFADHCDLLVERAEDWEPIFEVLRTSVETGTWKYVEIRPGSSSVPTPSAFRECASYCLHTLSLRPSLSEIFRGLHRSSTQSKIRRAERILDCEEGRSDALLEKFYRLHLLTRRRHRLPPQPIDWFRNLIACLGDKVTISLASKDGGAVGGIVTLRHGQTLVYKYGASDARFHSLGTMPLLFWNAIRSARECGLLQLDLGRSNLEDTGLLTFKDRLGAARSTLTYFKYAVRGDRRSVDGRLMRGARAVFAHMPDAVLVATGRLFYKHVG
jgi:hypothetical protein